jgi:hypothetical protein
MLRSNIDVVRGNRTVLLPLLLVLVLFWCW